MADQIKPHELFLLPALKLEILIHIERWKRFLDKRIINTRARSIVISFSKSKSDIKWMIGSKELFNLTTHSAHLYGTDIWLRTTEIARKVTCCHHYMGYSFQLAARDILYVPSHRQDSTHHSISYTSCGALAGTRLSWQMNTPY